MWITWKLSKNVYRRLSRQKIWTVVVKWCENTNKVTKTHYKFSSKFPRSIWGALVVLTSNIVVIHWLGRQRRHSTTATSPQYAHEALSFSRNLVPYGTSFLYFLIILTVWNFSKMEIMELVNPHFAFPVVGVVLCALLVYAFGFKSSVQPPSFNFDDDEKRSRKSKKSRVSAQRYEICWIYLRNRGLRVMSLAILWWSTEKYQVPVICVITLV